MIRTRQRAERVLSLMLAIWGPRRPREGCNGSKVQAWAIRQRMVRHSHGHDRHRPGELRGSLINGCRLRCRHADRSRAGRGPGRHICDGHGVAPPGNAASTAGHSDQVPGYCHRFAVRHGKSRPNSNTQPNARPPRNGNIPAKSGNRSARQSYLHLSRLFAVPHHSGRVRRAPRGPILATSPPNPYGSLPNDPAFLRRWIANPQAIKPGTLMPDLNLSEQQVNDGGCLPRDAAMSAPPAASGTVSLSADAEETCIHDGNQPC